MNTPSIIAYLVTELIFASGGFLTLYLAWKFGKIGLSILTTGYVRKGAGFGGKPPQDVDVHKSIGCLLLALSLFAVFTGFLFIIGPFFML
jgi:hypothetical protein